MGNIGKATEPRSINNNQWQPTQVTDIYLTVLCTPFINRFMYRQHVPVYDLEKRRGDCLIKWLIMLGFIDLRGPRVCRRSTPVLWSQVTFIVGKFHRRCLNHQSLKSIWKLHVYNILQISQGPMSQLIIFTYFYDHHPLQHQMMPSTHFHYSLQPPTLWLQTSSSVW